MFADAQQAFVVISAPRQFDDQPGQTAVRPVVPGERQTVPGQGVLDHLPDVRLLIGHVPHPRRIASAARCVARSDRGPRRGGTARPGPVFGDRAPVAGQQCGHRVSQENRVAWAIAAALSAGIGGPAVPRSTAPSAPGRARRPRPAGTVRDGNRSHPTAAATTGVPQACLDRDQPEGLR